MSCPPSRQGGCLPYRLTQREDTNMGSQITGGVDTHLDVHVAAALDEHGGLLGTASFDTTPEGYSALIGWLCSFGDVALVGVEGTGSYGTGLTRYLQGVGIAVVEVDRPNRQRRRRAGKSDTHDASAARTFAGDALGAPKTPRQRRSDPGAARGSGQCPQGPHPGVESDPRVDHDRARRAAGPTPWADDPQTASRGWGFRREGEPMSPTRIVLRSRPSPSSP